MKFLTSINLRCTATQFWNGQRCEQKRGLNGGCTAGYQCVDGLHYDCVNGKCYCQRGYALMNGRCIGLAYNSRTGHYYYINWDKLNWDNANRFCMSIGMNLVTTNDIDEQNWIVDQLVKDRSDAIWTGANYYHAPHSFTYRFRSGIEIRRGDRRFAGGEPNDWLGIQGCICIYLPNTNLLDDQQCWNLHRSVCEDIV